MLIVACLLASIGVTNAQTPQAPGLTDEERAWLAEHPTIRIGPAPNFPPVESFDEQEDYVGIAADYAAILQSRLGVQFEIVRCDAWSEVVERTRRREIDIWMEAADTPERRKFMDFSAPYIRLPAIIIVRREVAGDLDLEALGGLRVAVVEGYATHDFLREKAPELELTLVPNIRTGLERVSFGSADAMVANVAAASYYIERGGLTNLRAAGESGFEWLLSVGTRNDWPLLGGILQKALDDIGAEDRREIYRRWIALDATRGTRWPVWQLALAVGGLLLLVFVGLRKLTSRRSVPSGVPRAASLLESWPTLVVAGIAVAVVIIAATWSQSILAAGARKNVANSLRTVLNTTSQAVYDWFRERGKRGRELGDQPGHPPERPRTHGARCPRQGAPLRRGRRGATAGAPAASRRPPRPRRLRSVGTRRPCSHRRRQLLDRSRGEGGTV